MKQAAWVRPLALTVSIAAHTALCVQVSGLQQPMVQISEQARMTEIRLTIMQPAPTEPTLPVETQSPAPKPEQKRPESRNKAAAKKAPPKPPEQQTTPPPLVAAASLPDKAVIEDLRRRYIAEVMALIEAHKFYPSAARRRRVEGDVRISLLIDNDGRPRQVQAVGRAEILTRAARESLDATPIPAPPAGLALPVNFDFVIQYRLG